MRPANIITALADILAGAAIVSGGLSDIPSVKLGLLLVGTAGLYGGGVVFNDYFDADLDKVERPERPIPSGQVTKRNACLLGTFLFILGVGATLLVNPIAGIIAFFIIFFAVLYNARAKHTTLAGPLNMGLCRGLNLLLGMSLLPARMLNSWYLLFLPVVYIAAITSVSKGEVHGSERQPLVLAILLYVLIFSAVLFLGISNDRFLETLPFSLIFLVLVFPKLLAATKHPSPGNIKLTVKAGVISLIVLNACLAAAFAGIYFGIIILSLLPLSMYISRSFAVT